MAIQTAHSERIFRLRSGTHEKNSQQQQDGRKQYGYRIAAAYYHIGSQKSEALGIVDVTDPGIDKGAESADGQEVS